jgi:hypothetical protein
VARPNIGRRRPKLPLALWHCQPGSPFPAMKSFNRRAKVSMGFCREAATDHSPGLQPWVRLSVNSPRRWRPKVGSNLTGQIFAHWTVRRYIFRPYRASSVAGVHPGLKAWAMICNRFAVHRTGLGAKALGCSLRLFHDQELPGSVNLSAHSVP